MDCGNGWEFKENSDFFQFWYGLRGPAGPAGPPGSSVELRGPVASTSLLPESASSSELWMVGASSPYVGYFWNGTAWIEAGYIMQGPQGEPGADGADGVTFTPTVSSAGVISWTNDGGLPNPESVNIKGPAGQDGTNGQDGAPGAAAGFGTPTATVDGNVGTPSVTVTASGPDTAKVFAFAFSNLKGEPGSGSSIDPYTSNPADLASAASPGVSSDYSRGDHVHKLPSASDIGAYVKPSGGIPASDLASGVIPTVPTAYTSNPEMDGSASPGSSASWAKGDHVHPTDTSRAAADLGVTGATANQYVQITAVDANGKPTAFGPGTPSGGGDALYLTNVAISATTGDIATVSNNAITVDHVLVSCVFASPANITTDVTWTTASGSLTLNGTCSAATTADIVLVKKSN